jgi:hypothetical protein
LARVDLNGGEIELLAEDIHISSWAVSPDGRYVAYLEIIRSDPWACLHRLCVVTVDGTDMRVLDPEVMEDYGVSISWSADSTKIAYCPNHGVAVVELDDPVPRVLILCALLYSMDRA